LWLPIMSRGSGGNIIPDQLLGMADSHQEQQQHRNELYHLDKIIQTLKI
jgi:hypothetical protein